MRESGPKGRVLKRQEASMGAKGRTRRFYKPLGPMRKPRGDLRVPREAERGNLRQ